MKIVRFRNGTYGVRRFSLSLLSYTFRDLDIKRDHWWFNPYNDSKLFPYYQGTLKDIKELFIKLEGKLPKETKEKRDIGIPLTQQEYLSEEKK